MGEGRVLVYTCCNGDYRHFIPLFCAAALYSSTNIDIEIGVDVKKLTDGEETALEFLRMKYPKSRILIRYNMFHMNGSMAVYNGQKMLPNTVRFVSTPEIKDEYVYISDVDIPIMDENFYEQHIKNMSITGLGYSNMVRKDTTRLTGLHFTKYDNYYPLSIPEGIDYKINDEMILFEIVKSRGIKPDLETTFRPVHGIHFSPNRPYVGEGHGLPGWGADQFRNKWDEFTSTEIYKKVNENLHEYVIAKINKLEAYYSGNETNATKDSASQNNNVNTSKSVKYGTAKKNNTIKNTSSFQYGFNMQ